MKKLLKFARLAIVAIAWASAAQPGFAQCAGPCASELTQLLNMARLVDQLATQGKHPHDRHHQLQIATVNTTPFSLPIDEQQWRPASNLTIQRCQAAARSPLPAPTFSLFTSQNSNYNSYLSSPQTSATAAAKYQQWSTNTNSSVLSTLQAGQLQSTAMTGTEQSTLSGLKTQIGSAQGNLQVQQANGSAILFTAQELQSLRQLILTHTSLQANAIQTQSDKDDFAAGGLAHFR